MKSIPVSQVVKVDVKTSPTFPKRKGFGLALIVGRSQRLPVGERVRPYSSMEAVAADFDSQDEEYKAAQIIFSQSPKPSEVAIARRFDVPVGGELLCGRNFESDIQAWKAVTNGSLRIRVDGVIATLSALDFSAVTNLNAVAALIGAQLTGASVFFTGERFIIRSDSTGVNSTVDYATPVDAGTDISGLLGARNIDLGITTAGRGAETIADALDAINEHNPAWYWFGFTKEITSAQALEAAAWAKSRIKIFVHSTGDSNIADGVVDDDLCSFLKNALNDRAVIVYAPSEPYQALSVAARAGTVNFSGMNTTITLKFKQLPGTQPTEISEAVRRVLVGKNCNHYSYFGDSAILAEGVTASGKFIDEVHGLDWLQNALEVAVFGVFLQHGKLPQTDRGMAIVVQAVEGVLVEAVRNGLLAPGRWNGGDLGEVKSGDYLPKGFYVYVQPVAEQNQSDREARKAPLVQILAKGGGAFHFCDIQLTFER